MRVRCLMYLFIYMYVYIACSASRTLVLLVNDGRYDGILRSRRVDRFIMHGGCELLLKVISRYLDLLHAM
jgi:hypothetical protein